MPRDTGHVGSAEGAEGAEGRSERTGEEEARFFCEAKLLQKKGRRGREAPAAPLLLDGLDYWRLACSIIASWISIYRVAFSMYC